MTDPYGDPVAWMAHMAEKYAEWSDELDSLPTRTVPVEYDDGTTEALTVPVCPRCLLPHHKYGCWPLDDLGV